MKAVSCSQGALEVVDLPNPAPQKGQLVLAVRRCGICGSDLHARHHADELQDVMTAIGYRFLGHDNMSHADADWPDRLAKVRELALLQGKQAWITEAQAEPWESGANSDVNPKSTSPQAIRSLFANLKDAGFSTVLFWGAEYWLWQADRGDTRWIDTIKAILRDEAKAPSMAAA